MNITGNKIAGAVEKTDLDVKSARFISSQTRVSTRQVFGNFLPLLVTVKRPPLIFCGGG